MAAMVDETERKVCEVGVISITRALKRAWIPMVFTVVDRSADRRLADALL